MTAQMIEDKTPTVTARRRKPTQIMRIRLETARRLQKLNTKSKARRAEAKVKRDKDDQTALTKEGGHAFNTAPRVPKIKKNRLSRPALPDAKYRKRQRFKVWLPTHMFHAKRAHMATTKNPIWRFAIPISPTEKSYRPTHRANGARGAVAWDMSYMSTVQLEGTELCIEAVLRDVGIDGDEAWGAKGRKWRFGTRSLQAWAFENKERPAPIAPIVLIWCAPSQTEDIEMTDASKPQSKPKTPRRKLWIRIHPSAFLQLWTRLLEVSKRQNPPVMVEDLRFEIGSIEISGPGSTEALLATLQPILGSHGQISNAESPEATWPGLIGVSNPSSLPQNALLAFSVTDPRLQFPPRSRRVPDDEAHMNNLAIRLSQWSLDRTQGPSSIFDRPSRLAATRQLSSQKAINRRRTLAGPGAHPLPQPDDPQIPVIVLANRPQVDAKKNSAPGSWTVLLPWKFVRPVWYSLMFYPLSSGGNPRFGGLKEQQQLAFEAGEPWFPGDFPGTKAGWEWSQKEAEKAHLEWERRPKGRRAEYDSLSFGDGRPKGEVGRGWTCDWERLVQGPPQDSTNGKPTSEADTSVPPLNIHTIRYPPGDTNRILSNLAKTTTVAASLVTIHITLSGRGTPTPHARIYRLPTDFDLRKKWLDLASTPSKRPKDQKLKFQKSSGLSHEEARRQLADSLISTAAAGRAESDHLSVPLEEDLIGFVTTGNHNLSEGKGTGIGSILLSKVLKPEVKPSERKLCIVRAAGETIGRLGVWELV